MRSAASLLCCVALALSCLVWHNCDAQQQPLAAPQRQFDRSLPPHFAATASNESDDNDEARDDSNESLAAQRLTALLNQYRRLIAKSILRLSDACSVYDRLAVSSSSSSSDSNEGTQFP